ncbi:3-hydroxyisobutyrate dehydrogenase [Fusarium pseudocircinatum]|uniref:3-hydroxyisobutyrate dehydrogenase n=1 Tax=Fusarium pseudocircinatum TaxID=56676 RepID=A0A8H5KMP4_9HYPO|nr:3-hydroxyisobutyrate dehydrogenase [Fusarium pseudocircinatum]
MEVNIGFIGLGAIGYPMAAAIRRGLSKASSIHIFDVHRPTCQRFHDEFIVLGPIKCQVSPKRIAAEADIVISMVPGPKEVLQVYLDPEDGIISAPKNANRLLLECSTIDVTTARDTARQIKEAGQGTYVDAPVSGGVPAAEQANLSFLIGHPNPASDDDVGRRILHVTHLMGDSQKLFWCGTIGSGLAAKISNNYISCSVLLLVAEAMAIGVRSGVDPKMLHQIIHNSTGQTFMGDNVCPVPGVVPHAPSSNNWRLGFKTQMFLKDLSLGIEAARKLNLEPAMAQAAYEVYERASQDPRCIDRDGSSVYLHITDTEEASEREKAKTSS